MTRRWWPGAALLLILSCPFHVSAGEKAPLSNAEPALAQLARDLADQSQSLTKRLEIVRALGSWGTAQVRDPLLATLKDPSPELREAAARALGWPGNREAGSALRERVETESAPAVKAAALEALGRIGDPSTRPFLTASTQDRDSAVRQAAVWAVALGPLADPSDRVKYLIQLAEDRAFDGQLRSDAIRALFTANEDRVTEAFLRILEQEPRVSITLPDDPRNQQQIMQLRRMQSRDVAAWAAGGLGQLQAKRAVALLLRTAEDPTDFFLRLMSMQALIDMNAPEAQPVFLRRLEDPLPDNRVLALQGLGQLADRTVIPPVLTRLNDANGFVRAQAVIALAVLGDVSVRPALENLRKMESDDNVLIALEEALAHLSR